MAAITLDGRQELVALYLTMFDRAPTTIELAQMVVARENGSTLVQVAASLATNDDFALVASKDADSFATYLADALLASDTPAAARTWAINWVVTNVQGAKSKSQVIAEAVQAIRATTNTNYTTAKAILTADVDIALTAIDNPVVPGQVYTLSTSATDVVSGASSSDTIIGQLGQSITLQASDNINGGGGADVFRVVSDGAAAQSAGGFSVINVETLEVQAQATGGTTLSLENVTGVSTIRSSSSNGALTLDQVKAIAALEVVGALGGQALTVNYQAAATTGTNTQNIALNGNALGALTIGGIEVLAVSTNTAASTVASITGAAFTTVNVSGDKGLTITAALPTTVKTVDASAQTAGGTTVTLTNAADVAVKGGAGNDSATFTGAFTAADSFDGGAGTDTIIANVAEFTANTYSAAAKISNVEVVRFADALTVAFDASKVTGENTYTLKSFTGPVTISKADDASTVNIREASTGTLTYSIGDGATLATATGTANTVTVNVGVAGPVNGINAGTVDVSGVETVKIGSSGSTTTAGGNTLTVVDTAATSVTITGSEDLALTMTGTALTSLDASAATGAVDVSLVTYKAATAATITGGAGADKINGGTAGDTIVGGAGADVIAGLGGGDTLTGGDGIDTFSYNAASDSGGAAQDTITDFVSGTDLINLSTLAQSVGRATVVLKNGAATDFGNAQSSIALNSGNTQVVYQADTNTLWVDLNDDGTLNNNDLAIKLTGVTKIVAADIGGTSTPGGSGNFITLSAAAAVVNTTTSTNANAFTTEFNDTIKSTHAQLVGSTINGAGGTDVLQLTDAGTGAMPAGVTNVESLQLSSAGNNTAIAFDNAGSFMNVTGGTAIDTIADTVNLIEGGTVSLGDGADVITALNAFEAAGDVDTSVKFNIDMGAGDDTVTTGMALVLTSSSTLAGGAGNDTLTAGATLNLKDGNVSGFEILGTGGFAITLTAAQYAAFTGGATGAGAITFSDSAAAADVAASTATTYALNAAGQTLTGNAAVAYAVTGGAGNDRFILKAGFTTADTIDLAGGTGDTFEIAYNVAGAIDLNGTATTLANVENLVISVAQSAAYTLTLDAALVTADLSAAGTAGIVTTVTATNAAMTSLKLGVGNDVITTVTANTAATTIELGAGNDTISALNVGNLAMTLDFGTGNATITDIAARGTGVLTVKFAAPVTGATSAVSVAATTANFLVNDILDFATAVTSIVSGAANGTLGVSGATGQVFVDTTTTAGATIITFDADGSRSFSAGDVQITVIGNVLSGGINADGNFVIGASA